MAHLNSASACRCYGSAGCGWPHSQLSAWASVKTGQLGFFLCVVSLILTVVFVHMAAVFKDSGGRSFRASGNQGLEVSKCHFCYILLVKASHQVIPDSRQWRSRFFPLMGVVAMKLWPYLTYCRAFQMGTTASGRDRSQKIKLCSRSFKEFSLIKTEETCW